MVLVTLYEHVLFFYMSMCFMCCMHCIMCVGGVMSDRECTIGPGRCF